MRPRYLLLGIFILALCIRIVFISQMASTPLLHGLVLDSKEYDRLSLEILKGNVTHKDFVYLNAFYPFFLALVYSVFGHNPLAVAIVQAVIDALSCILVFYISSNLFTHGVALIAALAYACYGLAIFYTGILLAPTVVMFLSLLFFASLLFAKGRERLSLFCLSGILFGLLVLARSNLMLFLPVVPVWFFLTFRKKRGLRGTIHGFGLFLVGFLLISSVISLRNYAIDKRFSPFSVQGGINFYIGNNPGATGKFMSPEGIPLVPIKQVKASVQAAEKELGRTLTPAEASQYWLRKGIAFVKDHPFEAARLWAKKLGLFWSSEELSLNVNYSLSRSLVPLLQFPFISFGIIAPFAILGLALSARKRYDVWLVVLFIVTSMASVVIFFVSARYRMSVIPFLVMFFASGVYSFVQMIVAKEWRRVLVVSGVLLVLFWGVHSGFGTSSDNKAASKFHYRNLGLAYTSMGRPDLAVPELEKALSMDPDFAEAHSSLGYALYCQGKVDEAIGHLTTAIELKPGFEDPHINLGLVFFQQGKLDEAIIHYNEALRISPDDAAVYYNLGNALSKQGRMDEAIKSFTQALRIDPDYEKAHSNLGIALIGQNRADEAMKHFREALRINPDDAEVNSNLGVALALAGRLDEAIGYFRKALKIDPGYRKARINLEKVSSMAADKQAEQRQE